MFYMEKAVDALGIGIPETFEQAVNERNGWILTATQAEENIGYYRELLLEIGATLGDEARRDDEGQLHELPFPSKVKELAIERLKLTQELTVLNAILSADEIEAFKKIWSETYKNRPPMNIHPAEDPYRGSPHKFSRIPLPSGAPRMPSAAEIEAEALLKLRDHATEETGFGVPDNDVATRP